MLTITQCLTEYAHNPIGIGELNPRFSWILACPKRGTLQKAYRIEVARTSELLAAGKADCWDSQKIISSDSVNHEYAGQTLSSGGIYYWRVTVWDNHDDQVISSGQDTFEMGLLHDSDWRARWIAYPASWAGIALLFRQGFEVDKPVRRARLYGAGIGYYEPRLNGSKVGDQVLEPASTTYSKRVLYRTYDVTAMIKQGRNLLGAMVGHGWYGATRLLMQLNIELMDGRTMCIPSGWGWKVAPGPVIANSIYDGETYDARRDYAGWDTAEGEARMPVGRETGWFQGQVTDSPGGKLVAAALEPIRVVQTLKPVQIKRIDENTHVVDFGQNFAGWARIRVQGARGTQVTLRFAEIVYENGRANQDNLGIAKATDCYILKGEGVEEWEPRFTYHGFRYVQVEGWPGELVADAIDGRVVRSDVSRRGSLETDHDLVNRIQRAVEWTEGSNLHSIPTDCPQRSERMGWLNDLTARAEEAIYNYDMARFFSKFMDDIADAQVADFAPPDAMTAKLSWPHKTAYAPHTEGAIPDTVPHRYCQIPADPVCIGYLLVPWLLYQHYGDKRLLSRHYKGMKGWVDMLRLNSKDDILTYSYYGDWAPPIYRKGIPEPPENTALNVNTPGELVSTAFLVAASRLFSQIAGALGNQADQQQYAALAQRITDAFNRKFWNSDTRTYSMNSQSCNLLPLYFDMVPDENRAAVIRAVVHDVMEIQGGHLATGNICTKYLLEILTECGHADVAFKIATAETYPSWGYMLANGATTIWERWENATGDAMNSHNHPMLGSISSWFYRALAGLQLDASSVGASHFRIRPSCVSGLNHAGATLQTIHGLASASWHRAGDKITLNIQIPVNSRATVRMPFPTGSGQARIVLDGQEIWSTGGGGQASPDAAIRCHDHESATFEIDSGTYAFTAEQIS